jgi:DNA-binding CsgD family transcriptional regulator
MVTMRSDPIGEVLRPVYEATLDPTAWPRALASLSDLVGAEAALLFDMDWRNAGIPTAIAVHRVDPNAITTWQSGAYGPHDLWSLRMRHLPADFVTTGAAVVDPADLRRSPLYADILGKLGWNDTLAMSLARGPGFETPLSFYGADRFRRAEVHLVNRLAPHLRLAIRLQRQLGTLSERATALEHVVDNARIGVLTLQRDGAVVWATRCAEAIVQEHDGLLLRDGSLGCARSSDAAALRAAVAAAARSDGGTPTGESLAIARRSGRRAYAVSVAPLSAPVDSPAAPRRVAVLVTVVDPERRADAAPERLVRLLGLTPAEAALATALAGDRTLRQYAEAAGITLNTARWTLKQILQKTGCRRQSELVALVAAYAAGGASSAARRR